MRLTVVGEEDTVQLDLIVTGTTVCAKIRKHSVQTELIMTKVFANVSAYFTELKAHS